MMAILEERLRGFLARFGLDPDAVVAEVPHVFGPPALMVATGSVLLGFGNDRSDVDLDVVVEQERLSQLPIVSFANRARIDVLFYTASDVSERCAHLRSTQWPLVGALSRARWLRYYRSLQSTVRFAVGLALNGTAAWLEWLRDLQASWLRERATAWWLVEAHRRRLVARWLLAGNGRLACVRYVDAVFAALETRAAIGGQIFFSGAADKWLPEKLRTIGDPAAQAALRAALMQPLVPADVREASTRGERLMAEVWAGLPASGALEAQVWYAPGVRVRRLGRRSLVTRWDMRGVEMPGDGLPATASDEEAPVWVGAIDEPLPRELERLLVEDMLWVSVARRSPTTT